MHILVLPAFVARSSARIARASLPSRHLFVRAASTSTSASHQQRKMEGVKPGVTRIGWVGTGVMGKSMVGHLMAAGYSAIVYNRTAR